MARINPPATSIATTNLAGGEAYNLPLKERFVTRVMTCFWQEPKYYGDTSEDLVKEAIELCEKDPQFVAKTTIYAREQMNLRTVPAVLCGLLAMHGKPFVRDVMKRVLTRPDQMKEVVAYLNSVDEKLPRLLKQFKLGLADCFPKFNEYQLAKYNGGSGKIKLSDVLCLCHAKPENQEQAALWKRLLDDNLATPITWETQLSKDGNTAEVWDRLIAEKNLPYMASLRNLRNMIEAGATRFPEVLSRISDPEAVRKSKQFPFRFYSAYRQLQDIGGSGLALTALSEALRHSVENLPTLQGQTLCSADNSGSMYSPLSERGSVKYVDVANLFQAMMVVKTPDVISSVFGRNFAVVSVNPRSDIVSNAERFKNKDVGHSTNGYLAIDHLIGGEIKVDRIIMFTDCQLWNDDFYCDCSIQTSIERYRREINSDCWLHLIDLAGYGTIPTLKTKRVNLMAGWSDKILPYIAMVEKGVGGQISAIEAIEI